MEKIEVELSKTKIILLTFGGLVFLILGILFVKNPQDFDSRYGADFIKTIGFVSILFSIISLLYGLVKLFDKKLGLIIDANGITDNSSAIAIGLVRWKDIISVEVTQIKSTKFLLLNVKNPEVYISKASNFKALLMRANFKMYGTPICISSVSLKINFEDLKNIIEIEFQKNRP